MVAPDSQLFPMALSLVTWGAHRALSSHSCAHPHACRVAHGPAHAHPTCTATCRQRFARVLLHSPIQICTGEHTSVPAPPKSTLRLCIALMLSALLPHPCAPQLSPKPAAAPGRRGDISSLHPPMWGRATCPHAALGLPVPPSPTPAAALSPMGATECHIPASCAR